MSVFGETEFSVGRLRMFEKALIRAYPFVKPDIIGYSTLRRPIKSFTIGNGDILIAAAFHSAERVTAALLMRYLFDKADEYEKGESGVSLCAVPMVNPDGVQISLYGAKAAGRYRSLVSRLSRGDTVLWQANAAGVDINHNFNASRVSLRQSEIEHGFVTRGATRYGGKRPESEAETKALCRLCREHSFRSAIALHSQGREIYCDFSDRGHKAFLPAIKAASKMGYIISKPTGTAVGGGFKDWFAPRFRKPAFTIEVGKGKNPLPPSTADTEYKKLKAILDAFCRAAMS